MAVPAAVLDFPLGFSRLLSSRTNAFVFCTFRTLFKSVYPSHSIGFTASSSENVISRLFMRLRTLLKIGSLASPFESAPCALFCKNRGVGGAHLSNRSSLSRRDPSLSGPASVSAFNFRPSTAFRRSSPAKDNVYRCASHPPTRSGRAEISASFHGTRVTEHGSRLAPHLSRELSLRWRGRGRGWSRG